jgi:acetyl-CoA acyltransferase 2
MSQAPYAVRNIRFGTKLGQDLKLEDTLWQGLTDEYAKVPMGITGNLIRYRDLIFILDFSGKFSKEI